MAHHLKVLRTFASDNYSGIHPKILEAIVAENANHAAAYGDDPATDRAVNKFKDVFGESADVYFTFNGTAANVVGMGAFVQSWDAVICTDISHINTDECGAPEKILGVKLFVFPHKAGKLDLDDVDRFLNERQDVHRNRPKIISITQPTDVGTVYTLDEIKVIADYAHKRGMFLHLDGARLSNAAVTLDASLKSMTKDCGVDVLSFGGTKNGMMLGEAVVVLNSSLSSDIGRIRKQAMQLGSKMRFISAQFEALLTDGLYLDIAKHSCEMARRLENNIKDIDGLEISYRVQSNAVFATLDRDIAEKLQEEFCFYFWNVELSEVRWMTTWDTTEEDVDNFADAIQKKMTQ